MTDLVYEVANIIRMRSGSYSGTAEQIDALYADEIERLRETVLELRRELNDLYWQERQG